MLTNEINLLCSIALLQISPGLNVLLDIKPLLSITLLSQYIKIVLAAVAVNISWLPQANSFF